MLLRCPTQHTSKFEKLSTGHRIGKGQFSFHSPEIQDGFRKGRGIRDQIVNIHWIRESKENLPKIYSFIDYTNAFDGVDHNKLWKILKEMGITDHLTCPLRNLYASQKTTVRTGHGTTNWFQIEKGVR